MLTLVGYFNINYVTADLYYENVNTMTDTDIMPESNRTWNLDLEQITHKFVLPFNIFTL